MTINQINSCKYCSSYNDMNSNGYLVCLSCGTTKEREYVDTKPSLSRDGSFKNKQDFIGKSIDFVGSLGSQIGYTSGFMRSTNGKKLPPKIVSKYRRLRTNYHDKIRIDGNGTHLRTMVSFNRVFNTLNISKDIKQRALFIYWKHVNSKVRITNHILLIAVCLLQAVREAGMRAPIRFSEIISSFKEFGHRVTNKNLLRLARELQVPLSPHKRKAGDYIERLASSIKNDNFVQERVTEMNISINEYEMLLIHLSKKFLSLLSPKEIGGVQPYPFAVSIVYLTDRVISKVFQRKAILTQRILASIAKSAEFTIRDHVYRFLGNYYKLHETTLIEYCIFRLKE